MLGPLLRTYIYMYVFFFIPTIPLLQGAGGVLSAYAYFKGKPGIRILGSRVFKHPCLGFKGLGV